MATVRAMMEFKDVLSRLDDVLAALKDAVNSEYGFISGRPRINVGPCGPFAKLFRLAWNERLTPPADIAFVMRMDTFECLHIAVRLPDGRYFDGGFGVMTWAELDARFPKHSIVMNVMEDYDENELERWAYGLRRAYRNCPNFSWDITAEMIGAALEDLIRGNQDGAGRS